MSAPAPIANYVIEVSKDDPRRTITGFSPYSPSPVSPAEVRKVLDDQDRDLAAIQLAHYRLQTDRWIRNHNTEVERAEREQREAEEMRRLAEHKKREIEEDRRRRAELAEKERRRKEKGKGKEVVPEAGPSSPRKRKATEEPGANTAKRPKVSGRALLNKSDRVFAVRSGGTPWWAVPELGLQELCLSRLAMCRSTRRTPESYFLSGVLLQESSVSSGVSRCGSETQSSEGCKLEGEANFSGALDSEHRSASPRVLRFVFSYGPRLPPASPGGVARHDLQHVRSPNNRGSCPEGSMEVG